MKAESRKRKAEKMATDRPLENSSERGEKRKRAPELWQVVVECRDEEEQREVFERMKAEGRKVRVHVL